METIWKFPIKIVHSQRVEMPGGAVLLDVQMQRGDPFLWALVNRGNASTGRLLTLLGTGHEAGGGGAYVGTFQTDIEQLVWHLFDEGEQL